MDEVGNSYGYGNAYGNGYGDSYGNGYGYGYGNGNSNGYGYGNGNSNGYGYGNSNGYGDGNSNGYSDGDGNGYEQSEDTLEQYYRDAAEAGTLTALMALAETNAERKRRMIEALGPDRFFEQSRPRLVHQDIDGHGHPRQLLHIRLPEVTEGFLAAVRVICPTTGRVYHLGVPPAVKTCQAAVASTFGLGPGAYHPIRES